MPIKLSTTVRKIEDIPNTTNRSLLTDFHNYLTSDGVSESHQNNNLKALTAFAHYLGSTTSFLDIKENDLIRSFLIKAALSFCVYVFLLMFLNIPDPIWFVQQPFRKL
jgi:hypothetical protein